MHLNNRSTRQFSALFATFSVLALLSCEEGESESEAESEDEPEGEAEAESEAESESESESEGEGESESEGECRTPLDCAFPPEPSCLHENMLTAWASPGFCIDGECVYQSTLIPCPCCDRACRFPNACGGACTLELEPGAACSPECPDMTAQCAGTNEVVCRENECGGLCQLPLELGAPCDGTDTDQCLDDIYECDGTESIICSAGADNTDICNDLDDDCDGVADNGEANPCGGSCPLPEFGAPCDGSDADFCDDDEFVCNGINAVVCSDGADNAEICNGLDDDCDGLIDQEDPLLESAPGCLGAGVCEGAPPAECAGGRGWVCAYPDTYEEIESRCDCFDNDCDGFIDEESACDGAIEVSGEIDGTVEWLSFEELGAAYLLTGSVLVPPDAELVIAPGAVIKIGNGPDRYNDLYLLVEGTLSARGAVDAPIRFCSISPSASAGDWGGIYWRAGASGQLEHAEIRDGGGRDGVSAPTTEGNTSIGVAADGIVLANLIVGNGSPITDAIRVTSDRVSVLDSEIRGRFIAWVSNNLTLLRNRFIENAQLTLLVSSGSVQIRNNSFSGNQEHGLLRGQMSGTGSLTAENNEFSAQGGSSVAFFGATTGSIALINNNFIDAPDYHVRMYDMRSEVNARFNYWGSETTAEMESEGGSSNINAIFDRFDDFNLGIVLYSPWLAEPALAGP